MAKGLTNGAVPMGAVLVQKGDPRRVHAPAPRRAIEFFHGYTYSGHPPACAAGIAAIDIYTREGLFERAKALAPYWQDAVHGLKSYPAVIDVRNYGLVACIEYDPIPGQPAARGFDVFLRAWQSNILGSRGGRCDGAVAAR